MAFFLTSESKKAISSLLTENMFQDNKEDMAFLLSDEGKKKLASVHVQGILNYMNSGNK